MNSINTDVRKKIKDAGLYQYQVAKQVGISEAQFIRWLRNELPREKKVIIYTAIEKLSNQRK